MWIILLLKFILPYHLILDCWFQDPAAMVIDHTSYAVSETEGDHTLIASDDFIKSDVILGDKKIEVKMFLSLLLIGIGALHNMYFCSRLICWYRPI